MTALLPLLLAAVAVAPAASPDAALQAGLPEGQVLVQTLRADLDRDGKKEWIAIGEPSQGRGGAVSIAIFGDDHGKPVFRWAQHFKSKDVTRAGAMVRPMKGLGMAVVLVAAAPDYKNQDSTFYLQIYGWARGQYRPLVPEVPRFVSQGGFSIEERSKKYKGEEIVAWNYMSGEGEGMWDPHRYAYRTYHWDGLRWAGDDHRTFPTERYASYAAAAKGLGIKGPELRRQIPRVAEVP